ncbi:uncharacterized protein [Euphorbia lathyris]|uniref:uncharacterized protein n=1 Tax=Euphorbia lathyris TaxID=212925 RepID=UPI0033133413
MDPTKEKPKEINCTAKYFPYPIFTFSLPLNSFPYFAVLCSYTEIKSFVPQTLSIHPSPILPLTRHQPAPLLISEISTLGLRRKPYESLIFLILLPARAVVLGKKSSNESENNHFDNEKTKYLWTEPISAEHTSSWRQEALVFIIAYDILFGQEVSMLGGAAEKFIRRHKNALQSALAKLVVSKEVQNVDSLIALYHPSDVSKPCYVRVNT